LCENFWKIDVDVGSGIPVRAVNLEGRTNQRFNAIVTNLIFRMLYII
jgi:hypothetical protein